jgi:hypothetical protein
MIRMKRVWREYLGERIAMLFLGHHHTVCPVDL